MAKSKIHNLTPKFPLLSAEQEIIVNTPQGVQSLSDFVGGQSINTPIKVNQNHIESSDFETGATGWRIEANGNVEFNSGTFRGTLTAGQLHIPDQDTTANSFHANSSGDTWWGATETNFNANNDNATAYVLKTGVAKFSNVILDTDVQIKQLSSGTLASIQGWQFDGVFSATDADTVAWASGTLSFEDGNTYAISAGNTGNISARTYIYWDGSATVSKEQENPDTNRDLGLLFGSTQQEGQSFTTSSTTTNITQFKAFLAYSTGTADTVFCDIFLASGDVPTGSSLGQVSISAISNTSYAWYTFTFSTKITLSPSTKYIAVISSPNSGTNFVYKFGAENTGTYSGGVAISSSDSGSSWTTTSRDLIFETWQEQSSTILNTTTTASTAVGANKVLIAVVKNSTTEATFQVFGGTGGLAITGSDIENKSITTGIIADNAITTALVAAGAITETEVGDLAISTPKLAAGAVTAAKITAGTITANEIAASTITATEMNVSTLSAITADLGSITAGDISLPSGGFILSGQTAYDTGTGFYLGNDSGTPKFSIGVSTGNKLTWDGTTLAVKGAITIDSGSGIANLSDAGALAVLNTVGSAEIDALAVTSAKVASSAITTAKIATDAVTAAEIATGAVGSNELAAGAVIAGKITAGTIVAADIASGTITANEIAALTITASEIAASTITSAKMSVSQLSAIAADLGTITAGSIDISSGKASISSAGAAVFKSIKVGGSTTQYTLNDNGIGTFGDSSDGALTTSGDVALTADKYYTDLTISTGDTFNPAGYRIFVSGTLTINGTISGNGNDGQSGDADGGGGGALPDGYLKGSLAGGGGGLGAVGINGVNTLNSLGSGGANGGDDGSGSWNGGTGGSTTASNIKLIANWHLLTLLDISSSGSTVKFDNSASAGGGGGGNVRGGGAGSAGRIIAIYAKTIIINASGVISSNGGNGGAGRNGSGNQDGAGGGGGGNGGQIILVYNTLINNGSITATAGTGGTFGLGAGSGSDGTAGGNGTAGTIRQFNISL